jgi:hypothetical protein
MSDPRAVPIKRRRFELLPFDEIEISTQSDYLIKGVLPRFGLGIIWGQPKCGKSFWLSDALLHVALGWEYRGRRVTQGPVVYCAFEGAFGFRKRVAAFRTRLLDERDAPVPFYLLPVRVDVIADHAELIGSIRLQLEEAGQAKPVAVAFDTLNRSLRGSESDDGDMGAYIAAADAVREAFDCAVLIVHHCGVEGTRPRGHSSLTGAVDAQLAVRREGESVVVEVEEMKDNPDGERIISRLRSVTVGTDDDGDPITSCIVEPAEQEASAPTGRKLSDRQKNAIDALCSVISTDGAALQAAFNLPDSIRAVPTDRWREELFSRGVLETDAKNPRADFKRLKEALQARSVIAEREGSVWLV